MLIGLIQLMLRGRSAAPFHILMLFWPSASAADTRYDKLLANFMGFVKLAAILIWLK